LALLDVIGEPDSACYAVTSNGMLLVGAFLDGSVKLCAVGMNFSDARTVLKHSDIVNAVAFCGEVLFSCSDDGAVSVVLASDLGSGSLKFDHAGPVTSIATLEALGQAFFTFAQSINLHLESRQTQSSHLLRTWSCRSGP